MEILKKLYGKSGGRLLFAMMLLIFFDCVFAQPSGASSSYDTTPSGYPYEQFWNDIPRLINEIQKAIKADPRNGVHYFNLAVVAGIRLQPPDLPTARAAYTRALELGVEPDSQLDKLLK